jgi:hypothetical protein
MSPGGCLAAAFFYFSKRTARRGPVAPAHPGRWYVDSLGNELACGPRIVLDVSLPIDCCRRRSSLDRRSVDARCGERDCGFRVLLFPLCACRFVVAICSGCTLNQPRHDWTGSVVNRCTHIWPKTHFVAAQPGYGLRLKSGRRLLPIADRQPGPFGIAGGPHLVQADSVPDFEYRLLPESNRSSSRAEMG